jgi:pyruvate dehydrogenase E1 component alpha subunit
MEIELKMPDLATTGSAIRVVRWLVDAGQPVRRGQPLLEIETDKATMEVEATATGWLRTVQVQPEDNVTAGQTIATIATDEGLAAVPSPAVPSKTGGLFARNRETAQKPAAAQPATPVPLSPARRPVAQRRQERKRPERPAITASDATPPVAGGRDFLLGLYERMVLIRAFEERVRFLFLEGTMPGTIHQCQGQEATAVGVCAALNPDDYITSTFRGHGHALAKGLSVQELLDELFGAVTGCCKGKGGSMHVGNPDKGMVPGIAIVAGGIPLAAGMALAFKMQQRPQVVACFFGDGAVAEGAFHEGVNLAAIWNLPVIFACENNLYGASTRIDKVMRNPRIADRAAAYGFRGETVDGNDVLAVHAAAARAAADCRAGRGPVLLELETYRRTGHSRRDPCHYQPKDEREAWGARDPIERFAQRLQAEVGLTPAELDAIQARVKSQIESAVTMARRAPPPTAADVATDVFA